jgi:23S rRNA pseudouridine2605 synthase
MPKLIRINKLLSQLGISSRRNADEMIEQGRVSLANGLAVKPGTIIDSEKDEIFLDGKKIDVQSGGDRLYILLNKPIGYITTVKDTHQRRIVMDLVPRGKGLFPVGRLDKDTTGALILTNDGELAHRLMHPSYEIEKIYDVTIAGVLKSPDISRMHDGVDIGDDKRSRFKVMRTAKSKGETVITVNLHEGRKRQIRRTFDALGYKVKALKRVVYAGIKLDVKEGNHRQLSDSEIACLRRAVKLK